MPISTAKKAAKRESTAQIVIERDAKIAELEAQIKILNFNNGTLIDDEIEFSAGESAIIELAALKVKHDRLTVKHENLEEFKNLQGEKLKKLDECLTRKLGKVDYKRLLKGLKVDNVEKRLRPVLAQNNDASTEAAVVQVASTATQWEDLSIPSEIKPGQFIEISSVEDDHQNKSSSKKKLKPSESVECALTKLAVSNNNNNNNNNNNSVIINELLKVVANLLYGCALSDEAHIGTLKKLGEIEVLADKGIDKVIKNRHRESIEYIFRGINELIDELRGSKRKMDLARKAFTAIYKLSHSRRHDLHDFKPFRELIKDFFIDVGNRGLFIQSTDNMLAILEYRDENKLVYANKGDKEFKRERVISRSHHMTRVDVSVRDSDNNRY